ncbi:MAG: cell division protein ZapA [Lachnospiraceae bacterium]|nr:cell division protein ZapA [Lachnospiraceae bacterium]
MMEKRYTEVTIDGRTYTLGGFEEEVYLQKIATYINSKLGALRETRGFMRQSVDYRNLLLEMNMADDYFREKKRADVMEARMESLEREIDDLKHRLVAEQLRREQEEEHGEAAPEERGE